MRSIATARTRCVIQRLVHSNRIFTYLTVINCFKLAMRSGRTQRDAICCQVAHDLVAVSESCDKFFSPTFFDTKLYTLERLLPEGFVK